MKGQQLQEAARGVMEGARPCEEPPHPAVSAAAERLAALLADVARLDEVPLDGNFFDDLGADSLVMAHFCARVRNQPDLPPVSMRDVYRHPTAGSLAAALLDSTPPPPVSETPGPPVLPREQAEAPAPAPPTGRPDHVLCGALQLLAFLGYAFLLAAVTAQGYEWISAYAHLLDAYLRSVVFGTALLLVLCALPVIATRAGRSGAGRCPSPFVRSCRRDRS
ncbi:phosphopantetheine-binding protein [Streptomyces coeruleofuscus]|uniref:Carrier domain-containing protein n=1 Tax=Streptomyces coeruleofuscus TaxID=66879 RepID=A0ABP5VAN8_9ACTN